MKFLGKRNSDNDSAIWLSNSDLMAGLMIIFLFIAVGFIREKAPEIVGQQKYIMNYLSSLDIQERRKWVPMGPYRPQWGPMGP